MECKGWRNCTIPKCPAKGMSSTVPIGAQQQMFPYPGTFYQFEPCIFHGQDTELDLNEAENLSQLEN